MTAQRTGLSIVSPAFVVYQLIFDILSATIFRVKENVSYKRINKTL